MGLVPDLGNQTGMLMRQGAYSPVDAHTEITAGAAAQTLTPKPIRATGMLAQSVNEASVFTIDGTDPTVTPGFLLPKELLPVYIPVNDEVTITVARAGTSDASFRYQWVREEG